ncbi:Armadillo type fold [Echinococcus multilocularis]|uniref:Armadillo type fold n=1 Tax=Echinococcus multilocularis TaxID=6211 RepID=A0A087W110_ECHMU|nr:Armadillo type fold [Echinococcus multilocularis]
MKGEQSDVLELAELLCASKKLDRDRGEVALREREFEANEIKDLVDWIMEKSENLHEWEDIYGACTFARILLEKVSTTLLDAHNFREALIEKLPEMDSHYEYRVRIAAGELMGVLCNLGGVEVFARFLPRIKEGIEENLNRDPLNPAKEQEEAQKELDLVMDTNPNLSKSSLTLFHDTAGWKNLETWMKCLHFCICGLGSERFKMCCDPDILTIVFKAVSHTNRFVRETGYDVLSTVIQNQGCEGSGEGNISDYIRVAQQLRTGLGDNWSRVRMAALKTTRLLFQVPPPPGQSYQRVYPILLPPLCLSRYYVAEGVKVYSQQTWCEVTGGRGREILTGILEPTLDYFVEESKSENHVVREAACACMAEVGIKLPRDHLRPHLNRLLEALTMCFEDQSWPVRDAACIGLGNLVSVFPAETRAAGYTDLMAERFLHNLVDCIPSVREGAAASIAKVLQGANDPELEKMYLDFAEKQLDDIVDQPVDSKGAVSMSRGPGANVVVRSGNEAHDAKHTNQVMYSCGSLATRVNKGGSGCCMDDTFQRPSQLWERADGAIRLIGEMGIYAPQKVTDRLLEKMVNAASLTHYPHHPYLLETACYTIKALCEGQQKSDFKRNLDFLLPVIAWAVSTNQPLAIAAAEECLATLSKALGPSVLRSRIEGHLESTIVPRLLNFLPSPSSH